tara:strand:- start:495 stop:884 length:390 start_codon:yes stop_codon:yes gene_type:complete
MYHFINGVHACDLDNIYGDWRIYEENHYLYLKDIVPYLRTKNKHLIKFDEISWKGKNIYHKLDEKRYKECDIKYPCILTEGKNPHNCKYRMIDGKHRMTKMVKMGLSESYFYIIDYNTFLKLLQPTPHL